ncbi:hypothetical protein NXV57_24640 [Bacteroides thetaiotaomicron]|nr:hypothetical protein [Bacteroides thetaiotaomicron]
MSKKIKQILLAIGAVCIISIAANIFLTITTIGQSNTLKDLGDQEILMHTNDSLIGEIKKTEPEADRRFSQNRSNNSRVGKRP